MPACATGQTTKRPDAAKSTEERIDIDTEQRLARTDSLDICYEQTGPDTGIPIVLLHGFPYDVRQYDDVRHLLARDERRIVVPYLRGFGPTRYRTVDIFRSGQQAALGKDLLYLLDALSIKTVVVAGYDWGGRAACVAAALWPERIRRYFRQAPTRFNTLRKPQDALNHPTVYAHWYQSYFNTEQGEIGLEADRRAFCRFLWQLWSPGWKFTDEEVAKTAESFDNPDFVATVIHSYRHRYANVAGDRQLEHLEARLARSPAISVPTTAVHGVDDQVEPAKSIDGQEQHFTGFFETKIVAGVGHCVPAEAPEVVADAIESLLAPSRPH